MTRGLFVTARASATFTGGASPAGSSVPADGLGAVIEAFQGVDFHCVQQLGSAVSGGPGQLIECDESDSGQGDGQFRQIPRPVPLGQIVQASFISELARQTGRGILTIQTTLPTGGGLTTAWQPAQLAPGI